jgi:hypothetical protein
MNRLNQKDVLRIVATKTDGQPGHIVIQWPGSHETPLPLRRFNRIAGEVAMCFAAAHVRTTQLMRDGLHWSHNPRCGRTDRKVFQVSSRLPLVGPKPLTRQSLKEDEDRVKDHTKGLKYGTHGVRGRLGVSNQIEKGKAHDQESNELPDPRHDGPLILPVFNRRLSNALPRA